MPRWNNSKCGFQKGHKSRLGMKTSEETKKKMSLSKLGKKPYTMTDEIRKNMSESHIGKKPWNTGTKGVVKIWNKGKKMSPEWSDRLRKGRLGKPHVLTDAGKISFSQKTTGKNHWNFQNKTPLSRRIKLSFKYRQWRSDIFTRDSFICQDCGITGGKLHAHHIKGFAQILKENDIMTFEQAIICEELWNINNGITLHVECHHKRHRKLFISEEKLL